MSERGKYNNLLITISIFLNIILTVMLIILVGQKSESKNSGTEADITGDNGQSEFEFVQNGDDVFVLDTDEFGTDDSYTGETLPTAEFTQTSTTTSTTTTTTTATTTTAATSASATTAAPSPSLAAYPAQTLATIPTLATVPTQPPEEDDEEDAGEWLDLWGANP